MKKSLSSFPMLIFYLNRITKVIGEVVFQTRINIAVAEISQSVPLQALGPKPPTLSHINFGAEADPNAQPHQSFLRQYVSVLFLVRWLSSSVLRCISAPSLRNEIFLVSSSMM